MRLGSNVGKPFLKKYCLRATPTLTNDSDIVSDNTIWNYILGICPDILSGILSASILTFFLASSLAFSLAFYSGILSGLLFWHSICHSIWHLFWHSFWHLFWHSIWHSICHSIWHLFWHSLWRGHCPLRSGDRRSRPAVPTDEGERRRGEKEKWEEAGKFVIKSRDHHLAGAEKNYHLGMVIEPIYGDLDYYWVWHIIIYP